MSKYSKEPQPVFLSFSGGGVPAGISEGVIAAAIEKEIKLPLSRLSPRMGVYASSAGSTIAGGLFSTSNKQTHTPLYSAQEALDLFKTHSKIWLPKPLDYPAQFIRSFGIKIPFSRSAFQYDEKQIEKSLHECFGDISLGDMLGSFYMPGHNNSAQTARSQAVLFHKIEKPDGTIECNPSSSTKLVKLIRAGTAVPGNMVSETIENLGRICDYGHLNDANRALVKFMKDQPPQSKVHYIELGPPRYHNHLSDERIDQLGFLRRALDLARSTANHSYSASIGLSEDLLGEDHVHDFSPDVNMRGLPKGHGNHSIFDTSRAHMEQVEEIVHDFILSDKFIKTCDVLNENAYGWQKKSIEHTAPPREKRNFSIKSLLGFGNHSPAPA